MLCLIMINTVNSFKNFSKFFFSHLRFEAALEVRSCGDEPGLKEEMKPSSRGCSFPCLFPTTEMLEIILKAL